MVKDLFTIGHSREDLRNFDQFLQILKGKGITHVVEVRTNLVSQYNPKFREKFLRENLENNGISYVIEFHQELGGYPLGKGIDYKDYYNTVNYLVSVNKLEKFLEKLDNNSKAVILCAEMKVKDCHRQFIAQTLSNRGWNIIHL